MFSSGYGVAHSSLKDGGALPWEEHVRFRLPSLLGGEPGDSADDM